METPQRRLEGSTKGGNSAGLASRKGGVIGARDGIVPHTCHTAVAQRSSVNEAALLAPHSSPSPGWGVLVHSSCAAADVQGVLVLVSLVPPAG